MFFFSQKSENLYGIVLGRSNKCSFPFLKVRNFMALFFEDPLYVFSSSESEILYGIVLRRSIICSLPDMKEGNLRSFFLEDPLYVLF
jgi:hypothetical protein